MDDREDIVEAPALVLTNDTESVELQSSSCIDSDSIPRDVLGDLNSVKVPITIVTEFGDSADIEKALTINNRGEQVEEWLELANGCICCSLKSSSLNAIESLMERRGAFDYILLETTGLANPGNIAPLFWVDQALGSAVYLDGIVTLVDAKNMIQTLDDGCSYDEVPVDGNEGADAEHPINIAKLQVSHADVILLNKSDLVSSEDLDIVRRRVQAINGLASTHITKYGCISPLEGLLLDLHAYDHVGVLDAISTIKLSLVPLDEGQLTALENWLQSILWDAVLPAASSKLLQEAPSMNEKLEIHRAKGRIPTLQGKIKFLQGVRDVFEIFEAQESQRSSTPDQFKAQGKLVLIGRGIKNLDWQASLDFALRVPTNGN
ncbi:MAG: hypothetical protein M1825_001412 [Sarcosagium campestre]|nr:MAG: hypothetical protein M1825_001412 [Sarcosagium campestre]